MIQRSVQALANSQQKISRSFPPDIASAPFASAARFAAFGMSVICRLHRAPSRARPRHAAWRDAQPRPRAGRRFLVFPSCSLIMLVDELDLAVTQSRDRAFMRDIERVEADAMQEHDLVAQNVAAGAQLAGILVALAQDTRRRIGTAIGIFRDVENDQLKAIEVVFQAIECFAGA